MTFIDEGLAWFKKMRQARLEESISINDGDTVLHVQASVIEPESQVHTDTMRSKTHYYVFLVNRGSVASLRIRRGLQITRRSQVYEVVMENKLLEDFNDPNQQDLAIPAKLCISPS